jgi:hypothetical protein
MLNASTNKKNNKGYVALISVIIVSGVGLAIALSILQLGAGSQRNGKVIEQSSQAKGLANACAEAALQKILDSPPFTGSQGLTLGQGSCSYAVLNNGGENRTINASGTVGTIVRKVKISLTQIIPQLNISSWQEAADF